MDIVTKIAPICLALIMLGLGLGLSVKDFTRVLSAPKNFFIGFFSQLVIEKKNQQKNLLEFLKLW